MDRNRQLCQIKPENCGNKNFYFLFQFCALKSYEKIFFYMTCGTRNICMIRAAHNREVYET